MSNEKRQSVNAFAESRGYSPNSVRWWLFNSESNGLARFDAVEKIGRRVYIKPEAMDRWIQSQQPKAGAA